MRFRLRAMVLMAMCAAVCGATCTADAAAATAPQASVMSIDPALRHDVANAPAATVPQAPPLKVPADQPAPKMDAKDPTQIQKAFLQRHEALVALAKKDDIDLYFEGDSITANWHSRGKAVWNKEFAGWKAANFGIGGDQTQHVLWRMDHGELDGVKPKVVVLMIGTNNSANYSGEEIAAGVAAIVKKFRDKEPQAKILLLSIFPRGDVPKDNPPDKRRMANEAANAIIAKLDDGKNIKFLNMTDKFPPVGTPAYTAMFPGLLHPIDTGYQVWADAMRPTLLEWLGPPAAPTPAETK